MEETGAVIRSGRGAIFRREKVSAGESAAKRQKKYTSYKYYLHEKPSSARDENGDTWEIHGWHPVFGDEIDFWCNNGKNIFYIKLVSGK